MSYEHLYLWRRRSLKQGRLRGKLFDKISESVAAQASAVFLVRSLLTGGEKFGFDLQTVSGSGS